jgi:lactoylglutathione lyase
MFNTDLLGMTLLRTSHHSDFSLYFLAHLGPEEVDLFKQAQQQKDGEQEFIARRFGPVIELTHNHGTESDPSFK